MSSPRSAPLLALVLLSLLPLAAPAPTAAATPAHRALLPVAILAGAPARTPPPAATATPTPVPTAVPAPTATPQPTPERGADTAFVYIPGLGAEPSDPLQWGFAAIYIELWTRGWRADYPRFSYAGGAMAGDRWSPAPYTCDDIARGVAAARENLATMLYQYSRVHPGRRYVLVGHSFGGLVAMSYLEWLRTINADPAFLSGVLTVDSPLLGVHADKSAWLPLLCGGTGQTQSEIIARNDRRSEWEPWLAGVATWGKERGVRVWTIGSRGDCLYWPDVAGCDPPVPGWSNDIPTQWVGTAAVAVDVPVDPRWPSVFPRGRAQTAHGALLREAPYYLTTTQFVESAAGAPGGPAGALAASSPPEPALLARAPAADVPGTGDRATAGR